MHFTHKSGLALAVLTLAAIAPSVHAQTYSAAGDFSASTNPNGVWSYGYENTLGGSLNLFTDQVTSGSSTSGWYDNIASSVPQVSKNFGVSADTPYDDVLQPGQLFFHPGPDGEYAIVRFTAAAAGTYDLNSSFTPVTTDGTTTDVHVLKNGTSLFDGLVTGTYNEPTSAPTFADSFQLSKGETVDFAVGYGTNGNYYQDSTGLSATLTSAPVPEASTTVSLGLLLTLGLSGLAVSAKRRKASAAA